jgi:UDP-glucose 4-epimerase
MKVLVTGGAGFIGSHIVDFLMKRGDEVVVLDNLSSGNIDNLSKWKDNNRLVFFEADLLDQKCIDQAIKNCNYVFHMAANPEVDANKATPEDHFKQNITATFNLLEVIRKSSINTIGIGFPSSSTVYGEPDIYPTPEDYGPLIPISLYGASKLACEALITAFSSMYGLRSCIYRLANVVGPRSNHGVVFDFVCKIKRNPKELKVLGDGSQSKSYLYISDCIDAMIFGMDSCEQVSIYNVGTEDQTNVLEIAEIVKEETDKNDAKIRLTGGVDGGRGWQGDIKTMQLDISKLLRKGWNPRYSSSEAIRITTRNLI